MRKRVVRERLENAFYIAEKEYGVTRLLDPEGEYEQWFSSSCFVTLYVINGYPSVIEMSIVGCSIGSEECVLNEKECC